jgi:hypothetical protein
MKQLPYSVTRDELISTAIPQETRTYKPITHQQLIDLTLESVQSSGFIIGSETYNSAREGNVANGRYVITNVADSEMRLQIGWQNSYDKSISLKFAIGTHIIVCSNGCVSGDYGAFKKKHVGEVQTFTPSAITEYIKRAGDAFQRMQAEREKMKNIEITKRTSAELIGRMIVENNIIESTQLNIIRKEMDNPSFNYGAPGSLWELYQHTTYAMKEIHPSLWMNNHIKAHSFFVDAAGILVSPMNIEVPEVSPFTQLEMFS